MDIIIILYVIFMPTREIVHFTLNIVDTFIIIHSLFVLGLISYLNTEICTSKQKKFPLVTFIDTPGLVDGGMNYPFDVNEGLLWLGDLVDLIFVFFDPIGQVKIKLLGDIDLYLLIMTYQ